LRHCVKKIFAITALFIIFAVELQQKAMSTDIKIILALLAVLVWVASWFVRRKNRKVGVILSWVAVLFAAAAVVTVWVK
jgi:hypothetical protein